ncbi:pentatricopeptide repeat-containing protein At1g31430-like [Pyrus communis]|uniref:pentatricopeptide repeat-containing protein At1g31430-like n=1 Tax=Pyrus communis TaxID=23211 RepID=UPI0035BF7237
MGEANEGGEGGTDRVGDEVGVGKGEGDGCRERTCPHRVSNAGNNHLFSKPWDAWERFGKVKVHGFGVKTGIGFDAYVCNSLIDMVESFKQVFDEMPERNRLCWNVTISRCLRCRRFKEALDVFRGMRCESNEKPDEATVVSTISACTALKNLKLGKKKFMNMLEVNLDSLLELEMHKCGCLKEGRRIFYEMPVKNVFRCTSMVSGSVNCVGLLRQENCLMGMYNTNVLPF